MADKKALNDDELNKVAGGDFFNFVCGINTFDCALRWNELFDECGHPEFRAHSSKYWSLWFEGFAPDDISYNDAMDIMKNNYPEIYEAASHTYFDDVPLTDRFYWNTF